jgi:hypothetical protein
MDLNQLNGSFAFTFARVAGRNRGPSLIELNYVLGCEGRWIFAYLVSTPQELVDERTWLENDVLAWRTRGEGVKPFLVRRERE